MTLNGVTKSHSTTFSSTGPWLSSVDDYYVVSGHADLGVMETSNTVLNTSLYNKVQPNSLLCWLRVIAANRLATNGNDWGNIFAKYHSGSTLSCVPRMFSLCFLLLTFVLLTFVLSFTPSLLSATLLPAYTNQWQVVDLNLFTPGAPSLTAGLLTVVEEIPGLVHVGDQTKYLEKHKYWPSFNVPYYMDVRAANGNFPDSWSTAPRNKLFHLLQGNVTSIQSMQRVMRWNKYQTTPKISGGDPCNAIACRADVRSTGTHTQSDFGAIDAKLSSFGSLMQKDGTNSLQVFAEVGPRYVDFPSVFRWVGEIDVVFLILFIFAFVSHDDQPKFCWDTSPVSPMPPHHLHPNCFDFSFETLVPAVFNEKELF